MSTSLTVAREDRQFYLFNGLVSAAALAFLGWLLLAHEGAAGDVDVSFMPALNACFNGLSAVLLTVGWFAIRARKVQLHRTLMVGAFASSSLFLIGYVTYHYFHGDTRFLGEGAVRTLYFAILISHVLLSMVVVPFALAAFYFAIRERFATHAKLMRVGLPIWLYVSVTGVVIYFLLDAYS